MTTHGRRGVPETKRVKEDNEGWWAVIVTEGGERPNNKHTHVLFLSFTSCMCICTQVDTTVVIHCLISLSLPSATPDPTKGVCTLAHTMKHVEIIGHLVVLLFCLYEGPEIDLKASGFCSLCIASAISLAPFIYLFCGWGRLALSPNLDRLARQVVSKLQGLTSLSLLVLKL